MFLLVKNKLIMVLQKPVQVQPKKRSFDIWENDDVKVINNSVQEPEKKLANRQSLDLFGNDNVGITEQVDNKQQIKKKKSLNLMGETPPKIISHQGQSQFSFNINNNAIQNNTMNNMGYNNNINLNNCNVNMNVNLNDRLQNVTNIQSQNMNLMSTSDPQPN